VKSVYIREAVRKAHERDGKSARTIARELGLSRNTVRKILEEEAGKLPRYRLVKPKLKPVMGKYLGVIEAWLKADEQSPRKQRHTARRIYERLRDEYGFEGSDRRVREVVAELQKKPKEVFLPLGFEPGEMGQVDWMEEATVIIAGQICRVNLFGLVLNYSGGIYFEAFERTVQEAFFQGHANAFEFLGGVPQTLTYDNLKTAVKKVLEGRNREENEHFVAFRSAYLFDSRFCQPAKGNEKGRIENMVKFAERNLLTPVPRVESLAELNAHLRERCLAYRQRIQARQSQKVGERLQAEQPHLLPLPVHPPECCRIVPLKADKSALVQFETNRYSVPAQYAYTSVWLKAFVDRIEITNSEGVIAIHPRLSGKHQESIRFEHYRKVLERKPGAFQHLRAVDKEPLPPKPTQNEAFRYPQVYVRPPDLSIYRQLLRNPDHDPASSPVNGHLAEEVETTQHPATVSQAGYASSTK
jgi:transposase